MTDHPLPDLTFSKLAYGTHQSPWDLRSLLYHGASAQRRDAAPKLIETEELGNADQSRLALIQKFHDVLSAKLERGVASTSIIVQLEALWRFVAWVDENASDKLTQVGILDCFHPWTDALKHRVDVVKDLQARSANAVARQVADIIARALDYPHSAPGAALVKQTRLHRPGLRKKAVLGTAADKQNLEDTFVFGHLLADLCDALDVSSVRGPIPLTISMSNGASIVLAAGLKNALQPPNAKTLHNNRDAQARAALADNVSVLDVFQRSRLLNLRVEAELLIFIAQTGMNLSQAANLRRERYRWQTDGEDLQAFRVYKGRRGGEAIFRCFKAYRVQLARYFSWLDAIGTTEADDRLFPFVYPTRIPPAHAAPKFVAVRETFVSIGVRLIGPRLLRNTRVNWLLRRSLDPEVTAEQAAHTKQTLLGVYAQPHHQRASVEILRFHKATDPSTSPPGPGACEAADHPPATVANMPPEAPRPDCISPEGCLFCVHHRDVESEDYCWKLASHAKLKSLELCLYKPIENSDRRHPVERSIDRLATKLQAISESSAIRAEWVRNAQDAVRSGRYHPHWAERLNLLEAMA